MSEQVEGQLTLFPADSPASRSPLPGSKEARKMTATSGQKWLGLSKNSGPLGLLEKMLLESSEWHSPIFYLSWKPVGIGQGHFLFQLALSEPDTGDTESQLWATPNTMDALPPRSYEAMKRQATNGGRKNRKRPGNLREQVNPEMCAAYVEASLEANGEEVTREKINQKIKWEKLWPTPKASLRGDCQSEWNRRSPDLSAAVKMYNTPTAQDAKNSTLPQSQIKRGSLVGDVMREMFATPQARDYRTGQTSRWEDKKHRSRNLNDQIAMYPTPTTDCAGGRTKKYKQGGTPLTAAVQENGNGQLNPYWVEWLMGFPPGWTEI